MTAETRQQGIELIHQMSRKALLTALKVPGNGGKTNTKRLRQKVKLRFVNGTISDADLARGYSVMRKPNMAFSERVAADLRDLAAAALYHRCSKTVCRGRRHDEQPDDQQSITHQ